MKKILVYIAIAAVIASCNSSGGKDSTDSDSVAVASVGTDVSELEGEIIYITKDSMGPVPVGVEVFNLPPAFENVYDKLEQGASSDAVTMHFIRNNREEFTGYDFGEGKIDVFIAVGKNVKVKTPDGELGLGDDFVKVVSLPGVETEWTGYDDGGMWFWVWNGIWFSPSQDKLPENLSRLLYNSATAPSPADFADVVKIGFVGTGLPF